MLAEHNAGATQSRSEAQAALQAVASHWNCPQDRVWPPAHVPCPSQLPCVVATPFAQLACPHAVGKPGMAQAVAEVPSHVP